MCVAVIFIPSALVVRLTADADKSDTTNYSHTMQNTYKV